MPLSSANFTILKYHTFTELEKIRFQQKIQEYFDRAAYLTETQIFRT
jgi:hypothetical protein